MKFLTKIIRALSKEEARGFRLFSKRIHSEKYDRKSNELYDLIRSGKYEENDPELVQKLYPPNNKNAFYRLKNRLVHDLERSLMLLHYERDSRVKVMHLLSLARVFLAKSEYEISYEYYRKAEKIARSEELNDLQLAICEELIQLANFNADINLPDLLQTRSELLHHYQTVQESDGLIRTISRQLSHANFGGRQAQLAESLLALRHQLEKSPAAGTPAHKLRINKCTREALLEKKDFPALETYLKESYQDYVQEGVFNQSNHKEKIVMLSWLSNALTKNCKFDEALRYNQQLHAALKEHKKRYYHQYIWTYYQGLLINYSSSDRNEEAIRLLEQIKKESPRLSIPSHELFVSLNLARLHFNIKAYNLATQHLNELLSRKIFQGLAVQIQIAVVIGEVILRVEQRDWEYAAYRLKDLKRKYQNELQKPEYAREMALIDILSLFVKNLNFLSDPLLKQKMEAFLESFPHEVGANELVSYKAWIHAHRYQQDYYSVIFAWNHANRKV
jgi:tetratricopeptide (TPR) repeat protein